MLRQLTTFHLALASSLVLATAPTADVLGQLHAPKLGPADILAELAKKIIRPGDQPHTNGDGVTVTQGAGSTGNATIDPAEGDASSSTTVDTKAGFKGSVEGIDSNDTVDLGSSNNATIKGTGGTVKLGGNSNVTVSNTGDTGSGPIQVNHGNMTVDVLPGMTVPFHTH